MAKIFYKWHRILGLLALVPVICWCLSGVTHPFMSNWFRPFIPQEVFKPLSQQQMKPTLNMQQVLAKNQVTQLRNFGLVNFDGKTYYQVLKTDSTYAYYSAVDGALLPDADKRYAIYLARYFTQDSTSAIVSATLQRSFDTNYQPINRLLPVWKISLGRPDGMDIYVETSQSRLGTFNNHTRKFFLAMFEQLHTWQFLAAAFGNTTRNVVMLVFVCIMLLSLLSGLTIYGLFWKRFKQITQKRRAEGRPDKRYIHRFHRQLGLVVSLVMFTFAISGGFHLWVKLKNNAPLNKAYAQTVNINQLTTNNLQLPVADSVIKRVSLAAFKNQVFYQVLTTHKQLLYFNTQTGQELANGDNIYANHLANYYRGNVNIKPLKTEAIKQFTTEYGFINKRLPVVKISYAGQDDWYIETSSASLATRVAGLDRAEGFSFIFLHKYFGMAWAGKDVRDIISMLAAAGVLVVSLFGFAAFLKNK